MVVLAYNAIPPCIDPLFSVACCISPCIFDPFRLAYIRGISREILNLLSAPGHATFSAVPKMVTLHRNDVRAERLSNKDEQHASLFLSTAIII